MLLRKKYLDILRIEAEDLVEDIEALVDEHAKRQERGEITNYVFLNNRAILQGEINGVRALVRVIDAVDPEDYTDLDQMVQDIEARIRKRIRNSNLASALFPLFMRKLEKVRLYVTRI